LLGLKPQQHTQGPLLQTKWQAIKNGSQSPRLYHAEKPARD
jgi:hypothetical protein